MRRASIVILLLSATAHAQRGIDAATFAPAMDGYGIFGTDRAQTSPAFDFGFQFHFDYASSPLRLSLVPKGQPTAAARNR